MSLDHRCLLRKFHLFVEYDQNTNTQNPEIFKNLIKLLTNQRIWKILINNSFNPEELKQQFNQNDKEEKEEILFFGIACILNFIRINITGPKIEQEYVTFLQEPLFSTVNALELLSSSPDEDIDGNVKFPLLLLAAKVVFESCECDQIVNDWWSLRTILIQQQVLDNVSLELFNKAEEIIKRLFSVNLEGQDQALLDLEIANLYILFHYVTKSQDYIINASKKLGIETNLVGKLGKRTKYQLKETAQLTLEVNFDDLHSNDSLPEIEAPIDVKLEDEVRLETIKFSEPKSINALSNLDQKLLITIVQDSLISKPKNELISEELMPYIDYVLGQTNTFVVRMIALLIRCKLEANNKRTIERALLQCEEVINSFEKTDVHYVYRVMDVFSTGLQPIWKMKAKYGEILLNVGLVKQALDVFLEVQSWEEVIVCYTILQLRHKVAEIIKERLQVKPTSKLWCLLGDATDDTSCYEKAWEISNHKSFLAQRHWGNFLFSKNKYEESIPHYEESVKINPLQASVWIRLGFAALKTENWQIAAIAYRRYTTLEPDTFEAWNNLAQAYIKLGNKKSAHQALVEAIRCNFDNWKLWENFLLVSCDVGRHADVLRAYHKLLDQQEKYINHQVIRWLVVTLKDLGDERLIQKCRELLGRITSIFPGEAAVWELYSELALNDEDRAQKLSRAYRSCAKLGWEKSLQDCKLVLNISIKYAEALLSEEISSKNPLIASARLGFNSTLKTLQKTEFEDLKDQISTFNSLLDKVLNKTE